MPDPQAGTVRQGRRTGCSPYETVLGDSFALLHAHVRLAHLAPLDAAGILDVEHGAHWTTPVLVWLLTLPDAGRGQTTRIRVRAEDGEVDWMRQIGPSVLRTRQHAAGRQIVERHGPGDVVFDLAIDEGDLVYRQAAMHLAGIRLPAFLSPHVDARVGPTMTGWRVDVVVTFRARLVCRYAGALDPS